MEHFVWLIGWTTDYNVSEPVIVRPPWKSAVSVWNGSGPGFCFDRAEPLENTPDKLHLLLKQSIT